MTSLHDFLDQQERVNEQFVVDSEEKCNWVLRKIRAIEEKKSSNLALAEAETAKIEAWLEHENGKLEQDLLFFKGMLMGYAAQRRAEDPKFKSLRLPNGKIRFQKQQPKWNYDDKTLIQALKDRGREDLLRIKEELDKVNIKKAFQIADDKVIDPETGEVIEGVTIEHREDELKIEVMEL